MTEPRSGRRRRQGGHAVIEFAFSMLILLPLFFGVLQFGYAFLIYNELENAVRAGARYASLATYDSPSSTPSSAFRTGVQNLVVYGNPDGGTVPLATNLGTANVTVTLPTGCWESAPRCVLVSIQNYPLDAFFATYTLNKPSAIFPYTGLYAPE